MTRSLTWMVNSAIQRALRRGRITRKDLGWAAVRWPARLAARAASIKYHIYAVDRLNAAARARQKRGVGACKIAFGYGSGFSLWFSSVVV